MKYVEIIVRRNMYHKTKEALADNGFNAYMSIDVLGRGKNSTVGYSITDGSEGTIVTPMFMAKKYIGIYILEEDLEDLITLIKEVNHTGNPGDGKIFVY